jgi:hypothetical protein
MKTVSKFIKVKNSSIKYTVNPPKTRKEFEILIRKLGYRDRLPVYLEDERIRNQINYMCEDGSAMAVYCFLIPFKTKKSHLYDIFAHLNWYNDPNIKLKISHLAKYIKLHEKTRIGEVGWEVIYTKNPDQFSMQEKTKIIFDLFQRMTKMLQEGAFNYEPKVGDILMSNPQGPKINEGFTSSSLIEGTSQRGRINKRFGFGSVKENNFQYARYDENLILRPI